MLGLLSRSFVLSALAGVVCLVATAAQAHDPAKYPDWAGQWRISGGNRWDPTKPGGRGQQAPLIPEYQVRFEESLADQKLGGPGNDPSSWCFPTGMPRLMTAIFAIEFVVLPDVTHILFENRLPRRVYTDGRDWPKNIPESFGGYSIGRWLDTDNDGRYDTLEIETRSFKGPRNFEPTGIPLHDDNQSIIKERLYLDKNNKDIMLNEMTTTDNAFTRPWSVLKKYRRQKDVRWEENNCIESNVYITINKEVYFVSHDGHLMPQKKGQAPPDLRYFNVKK